MEVDSFKYLPRLVTRYYKMSRHIGNFLRAMRRAAG